jgi:hypothetical protein
VDIHPSVERASWSPGFCGSIVHELDGLAAHGGLMPVVRSSEGVAANTVAKRLIVEDTRMASEPGGLVHPARTHARTDSATQPPWPGPLADEAFHGVAGDVVRAIRPHTEADDAALLISFLVAAGNCIGRGPYAQAEADRHGFNLFAVLVGLSAKGRKGSSWGHIEELFRRVDQTWATQRIQGGLASGEGLIWAVRDPIEQSVPEKEGGKATGRYTTEVTDVGASDKRLLVVEGEYAGVLKVMGREGNTLSPVIRQAWDNRALRSLTKNSPAQATDAHISIIGHVTRDELLRYLNDTEAANGFANRYLWGCTNRARRLPEGGGEIDYGHLVLAVSRAIDRARRLDLIRRDDEARAMWAEIYADLSEGKPGLLGAVTARAEAQVLRLSALYAALDGSSLMRRPHLLAGLAVWEYCEASARYIFGDATGDPIADRVLDALRASPGGVNRSTLIHLFDRNISATRLDQALAVLLWAQSVQREVREAEGDSGRGRHTEWWLAT